MKSAVVMMAVASASASKWDADKQINHPDVIDALNKDADTWKAGHNEFFGNMTFADARSLLGTTGARMMLGETRHPSAYDSIESIPDSFDARDQWKGLIHPIRDQQQCGSCWAFSATEVLADRFAIATGKASPVLSAEDIVSCDSGDMGCSGGQLPNAWKYLTNKGVVTDTCFPYTAGGGNAPSCASKCSDSESWTKYKAKNSYAINGVENMQKEIMTNGPIQVAFKVYKSFMSYKSGVYSKKFWELIPEGGHAVKIVGWGTESGTDYWLVANSWNTVWGEEGFFKIKRGDDECGMETMGPPYAGMPSV